MCDAIVVRGDRGGYEGSPDRAVIREKKWTVCVTAYGNTLTFPFEVAERKKCG